LIKLNSALFIIFVFAAISFAGGTSGKTLITGDEMEVRKAGEITILKGNSKVVSDQNVITAHRIIYDKKNSVLSAFDHVILSSKIQNDKQFEIHGSFANYYINGKKGKFWGDNTTAKYFMQSSSSPFILSAQEIYIDRNLETLNAYDDVVVTASNGIIYSDNAVFNGKTFSAVFQKNKKRPIADISYNDNKGSYEADEIIFHGSDDNKKIIMNGSVAGKIEMEDKHNDTKN
jgi:lipopolysaccharide assembly outer membrane protein LptD (OstA)